MSDAVGAYFPYVRLWAKNGRELSIEHYYGGPSVCFLPGAGFSALLSAFVSELRALEYDPEIMSVHVLLPKRDSRHANVFRAQNVKIIENEVLANLDLAFSLQLNERPLTAMLLDPQGRIVAVDDSPSVEALFAQGAALIAPLDDATMISERHAPVISLRSCIAIDDLAADRLTRAEQPQLAEFDHQLYRTAAAVIHKSYNFHVTRRSELQIKSADDEAMITVNQARRYSRFTCVIAGDESLLQLSFPEFSQHYYQLQPGDAMIFPSNLLCSMDSQLSTGELITLRFFDDASARSDQGVSDSDHFDPDAIERLYWIYIDGQPDIMPGYSVDDSAPSVD